MENTVVTLWNEQAHQVFGTGAAAAGGLGGRSGRLYGDAPRLSASVDQPHVDLRSRIYQTPASQTLKGPRMRFCNLRYPELVLQERTSVYHLRTNATGIYR